MPGVLVVTPHELLHYLSRWESAGLDPDTRAGALAMSVLARVSPAGAWAWALVGRQIVHATAAEAEQVRVLVAMALGVDE